MSDAPDEMVDLDIGEPVFDAAGNELGTIRGFDDDGLYVTTRDGIAALSVEHVRAGGSLGEAELMWRCWECGAMGSIDEIPEACPDCGAPSEDIYYWTED
jgi:hypothetical protein